MFFIRIIADCDYFPFFSFVNSSSSSNIAEPSGTSGETSGNTDYSNIVQVQNITFPEAKSEHATLDLEIIALGQQIEQIFTEILQPKLDKLRKLQEKKMTLEPLPTSAPGKDKETVFLIQSYFSKIT